MWQPASASASTAKAERAFLRMGVLFSVEAVFPGVIADDGCREDLRNVLHRLFGQFFQAVEVPEVSLLLAEADLAQDPEHAVLALVVAGDGEHERVGAELCEQVVEILGGDMGLFANVGALVVAALAPVFRDFEAILAGSEIHELPHPARADRRLGERVEVRLLPGVEGYLLG